MKAGWKTPRFGDVCELKKGKKPTLQNAGSDGVKPYLVAKYLRGAEPTEFASVSDKNSVSVSANEIIIICDGSNSGETFIGFDGILSSTMAKIGHGKEIDNRFLMHFLDSLFEKFNAAKTGAAIPHLDLMALRDEILPVPEVAEQHRIVSILDEAFGSIATAKANAERNLQNSRDVFDSYLQQVFTEQGVEWVEKPLGEIGKVSMCKRILKEQTTSTGNIPFYKIGTFGKVADAYIPIELYNQYRDKYSFPNKGEVLISAAGTIGRRVVYDGEHAYFQDSNIVWIANDQEQVLNNYLYHFFGACKWNSTRGATINRLYNDNLRQTVIAFPKSLHEQHRIAVKLDVLSDETNRLAGIVEKKLKALDILKQSLLHQAFSGAL